MRRLFQIGLVLVALVLVSSVARAETFFFARMTGNQEQPPVPTNATGTAVFLLTPAGLEYSVTVDGLTGPITAAHIHGAAPGVNGGVRRQLTFSGNGANGIWQPGDSQPFTTSDLAALFEGNLYINVHTAANPGGEIRGQIVTGSGLHLCAALDGNQENPAIATPGAGTASVVLSDDGLRYRVSVNNLTGAITAAHIHAGAIGVNGGVMAPLTFVGNRATGFIPSSSFTPAQIRDIIAGLTYVNVHTAPNPGGEIRGQLLLNGATAFTADLDAAQEVPPNGSAGLGTAVFSLTPVGLRFELTVDGLTGPITAAHFHRAPAGSNGGVVRDIAGSFTGTTATGVWRHDDPSPLTPALIAELLAGNLYVNVHTAANPGGEIRGQVKLRPGGTENSFSARLTSSQEEPPNASTGMGTGYAVLTAGGLAYRLTVSGLTGGVTAGHIHAGAIGVNGGVVVPLAFAGTTASGVVALAAADQTTLMNTGLYMNVHTAANPGGEIRGQIVPASGAALDALLTGAQEVPPTGGAGHATACYRLTRDGLAFRFSAGDLTGAITSAHFHGAGRGVNGGVIRGLAGGTELGAANGMGVWKPSDAQPLNAAEILNLFRNLTYMNLHTAAFPGGEVRSQVELAGGFGKGAPMTGSNEVPPNASAATGSLAAVLTSQGMLFRTTVSDLEGALMLAHIHNAPPGSNGFVVRDILADFAGLTADGLWSPNDGTPINPVLEGEFMLNNLYVNVHTTVYASGEVRGNFGPLLLPSGIGDPASAAELRLSSWPNPATSFSALRFSLPKAGEVKLGVFDITGRQVASIVNRRLEAGEYNLPFDASALPSGVYFYRLTAGGAETSRRTVIVR